MEAIRRAGFAEPVGDDDDDESDHDDIKNGISNKNKVNKRERDPPQNLFYPIGGGGSLYLSLYHRAPPSSLFAQTSRTAAELEGSYCSFFLVFIEHDKP